MNSLSLNVAPAGPMRCIGPLDRVPVDPEAKERQTGKKLTAVSDAEPMEVEGILMRVFNF